MTGLGVVVFEYTLHSPLSVDSASPVTSVQLVAGCPLAFVTCIPVNLSVVRALLFAPAKVQAGCPLFPQTSVG